MEYYERADVRKIWSLTQTLNEAPSTETALKLLEQSARTKIGAWTIEKGDDAQTAAGKIHTDLSKGFIRAEVFSYEELIEAGSEKELKAKEAAGALR